MSDERERLGDYNAGADAVQTMTMKMSKGQEFPKVALPGVGHMPALGEDEIKAPRVFYVAATRATQRLAIGISGEGMLSSNLNTGCSVKQEKWQHIKI